MRILVVADIHYSLRQLDWLVSAADDYAVVALAGDLLESASAVSLPAQVVVVRSYLERLTRKTRVLVCSGEHDLTEADETGERVAHWIPALSDLGVVPEGEAALIDGTLVSVLPWWDGRETRQRITAQLARDAERSPDRWIWLHHAPPVDSPVSWSGQRYHGDSNLTDWIGRYRPDAVFSGHVHGAPFQTDGAWLDRVGSTWLFNAGQQAGDVPAHIVYDTETDEVFWFSAQAVERQSLSSDPGPRAGLPAWLKA